MEVYEAIAYAMRYWFIFVIIAILFCVIIVSVVEYRDRKRIMLAAEHLIGYMDVVYTPGTSLEPGDRFTLAAQNEIGCGSHCNIQLSETGVMKKHAKIVLREDGVWLCAAAPGNTQVNGYPVEDEQELHSGDIVLVGEIALMVHLKEAQE